MIENLKNKTDEKRKSEIIKRKKKKKNRCLTTTLQQRKIKEQINIDKRFFFFFLYMENFNKQFPGTVTRIFSFDVYFSTKNLNNHDIKKKNYNWSYI